MLTSESTVEMKISVSVSCFFILRFANNHPKPTELKNRVMSSPDCLGVELSKDKRNNLYLYIQISVRELYTKTILQNLHVRNRISYCILCFVQNHLNRCITLNRVFYHVESCFYHVELFCIIVKPFALIFQQYYLGFFRILSHFFGKKKNQFYVYIYVWLTIRNGYSMDIECCEY